MARLSLPALIRGAAGPHSDADADLLLRFADADDGGAFAELVRRHGRLVWGQCRALLPGPADADDAFQATFLALARAARSGRGPERLAPWLYAVAHRVCLNARRGAARRRARERGAAAREGETPVADSAWDAAAAAVHEEVGRLPEALRVPFVLCCLEGRPPGEAAQQLGLKWGTFSARLSRAKQRVLDRLSARGFGPGAAVAVASAGAACPPAAVARAAALAAPGVSVPPAVLSLCSGVRAMNVSWSKLVAVLAAGAVGLGALFAPPGDGPAVPAAHAAPAAPVPKVDPEVRGKKLEELWVLLLAQDEAVSTRTVLELSARPRAEVIPFLAGKLKPLKLTPERARELVAALGDEKDAAAKAAFDELLYFDPRLALEVGDMLKDLPAGRHRQRVAALLVGSGMDGYAGCTIEYQSAAALAAQLDTPACGNFQIEDPGKPRAGAPARYAVGVAETVTELSRWGWHGQWGRATRAVLVLEHLGGPDAVKALEAMAVGHKDAAPTKAAKAALERLRK